MEVILALAGVAALIAFGPMIGVLAGAFAGAFAGYVVGWLGVPNGLALIGIHATADQLVWLGAALGFVGGFFKCSQTNNNKD